MSRAVDECLLDTSRLNNEQLTVSVSISVCLTNEINRQDRIGDRDLTLTSIDGGEVRYSNMSRASAAHSEAAPTASLLGQMRGSQANLHTTDPIVSQARRGQRASWNAMAGEQGRSC